MEHKTNILHISKKAFLNVVYILFGLILFASVMTFIVPKGEYLRDDEGQIISDSFSYIGDVSYPIYRFFTAPYEVLLSSDGISVIAIGLFLIILGGTFAIMDKTGGIKVVIKRLILRFKDNKYLLLRLVTLVLMMFGAFFGIFEESIALLPIMILLSLSLGWDTLTGMGMCLLAAGFGFASAVTNPFSVGVASELAGISILNGILYRLFVFGVMYFILQFFLVRYAKKIEKNPETSLTYEDDLNKSRELNLNEPIPFGNESFVYKSYMILFLVLLIGILFSSVAELFFGIEIPAIILMAIIFLFGGLIVGGLISKSIKFTFKTFLSGMASVAPAFILILLAVSVKHIISEAKIMDTILYYLSNVLSDSSIYVGIIFIYGLVLVLQFFIGSASAKAFLIMPILLPLVSLIGISKELAILAFIFGDGYTNVIFPTNAVLLIGLSIASVSYGKWFKFTYKLQIFTLIVTVLLLIVAVWIGY
jgi:uncharacterized ion transporter superfamily protein YfcC